MQTIERKSKVFKTYNEAMENLFPHVWKQDQREGQKGKKEVDTMKELAESILSNF